MLRKSKLVLTFIPVILFSCNSTNTTCKVDEGYCGYYIRETEDGDVKYLGVDFSFWIKDGKNKKISKNNFYAKVNNVKVQPVCIFSSVKWHNYVATYVSIVEEKELQAGSETYITQSHGFVGFAKDSGINDESKFYVNNVEVNTKNEVGIKL